MASVRAGGAIARIAALLGAEDPRKREKRLAAIKPRLAELEVRCGPGVDDADW
jgi:hypothetical protein